MQKKLLYILILICGCISSYGQLDCPELSSPLNGDNNVPVEAEISWNAITGAPGYLISIGTTPEGTEIENNKPVGSATSFTPETGLPENTTIYVTISIFFFNADNIVCTTEMFRTEDVTEAPACTAPRFPVDGSTNVNVGSTISWNYAPKATGYFLSLGTIPGGTDILNNENIIRDPFYKPVPDLPVDEEIFVILIPYNENGSALAICEEYSFTTSALVIVPECTSLVSPLNRAINVELSPILEWRNIPDATGYRVTIGTTPFNSDILNNATFIDNSALVIEFEPNLTFFVTIIPFNTAGEALDCVQESFSTILGCGPFFDTNTGEFVNLAPDIDFQNIISFCENDTPFTFISEDIADGFRWYQLDENSNEQLISSEREVALIEPGMYRYEAYNAVMQSDNTIECETSEIFEVVTYEIATITSLDFTPQNEFIQITVQVIGDNNFEYAVDNINGLYQGNNVFDNLSLDSHTFYVRDRNGCITEETFIPELTLESFPNFFTPNGDDINDFWQFLPSIQSSEVDINTIYIFDRFGNLLTQLDPNSQGWDGNFNGKPLPASDYWFRATSSDNQKFQGHFALKR